MSALIKTNHTGPVVAQWVTERAHKRALQKIDSFTFPPSWAEKLEGSNDPLPAKGTVNVGGDLLNKILSNRGNDIFFDGSEPYLVFVNEQGERIKPPDVLAQRLKERSAA